MNPLHALRTPGSRPAGNRTLGPNHPAGPLNVAARAVIALPAETAIHGLRLGRKLLSVLLHVAEQQHIGACAECGAPVTESDPFIRYRGDYYHADGCAERNPPALSRRQVRAGPTST
jgi:hypothetical protein